MIELWEILVPTMRNDGRPIHTRFHRVWDAKVKEITGGLTIMPVAKGYWNDAEQERMIPVRVACTRAQMEIIGPMTRSYYEQIEIMAFKVSTEVVFFGRQ